MKISINSINWIVLFIFIGFINLTKQQITKNSADIKLEEPFSTVIINKNITFNFKVNEKDITFILKTNALGYVGLGFGESMFNCDIMIIKWIQGN